METTIKGSYRDYTVYFGGTHIELRVAFRRSNSRALITIAHPVSLCGVLD